MRKKKPKGSIASVRALVGVIMQDYLVAYPERDCGPLTTSTSVTVNLSMWQSDTDPRHKQVIDLFDVVLRPKGWRADKACPVPEGASLATSNQ